MAKYTIAVVGCGRISQTHFKGFHEHIEGIYVKYACDLILEKAEAAKAAYPDMIGECITDYNIALADPEVEAVYVLTPNYAHYTVTMDALKAGKHVFCEKPVTVNYALSVEMAEEAKKQGKLLNIGVCNRYRRSVELLEEMNRNGEFGKVYHVICDFRVFRSIPGLGGDFTNKAVAGGGTLIDWGVHYLDIILYVLGSPKLKTVTCDQYCEMAKDMKAYKYSHMWAEDTKNVETGVNDVDDLVTGYIRTDAATISFNGAWAHNIAEPNGCFIDILGDKAGARMNYLDGKVIVTKGDTLESYEPDVTGEPMHMLESRDFLAKMKDGVATKNHIDNILETMKLLDYLYKSADLGHEIDMTNI